MYLLFNFLLFNSQVQPVLCAGDQSTLIEASLEKSIPIYASLFRFANEENFSVEASQVASQLLESTEKLVIELLRLSLDPGGMDIIFTQLLPWSRGQEEAVRRSSLKLLKTALVTLSKEVEFQPGTPTSFSQGHLMIAKVPHVFKILNPNSSKLISYFRFCLVVSIRRKQFATWRSTA